MWQRFTERARKVVFYAQEAAQQYGEGYVSTEHLLLGLLRENDSTEISVLESIGVSAHRIQIEVEAHLPQKRSQSSADMTLTPRAKRVIDLAYDEARSLNNNYIGSEHLLLGLIREGDGLAGRVLDKLGVELSEVQRRVATEQAEQTPRDSGPPLAPPTGQRAQPYPWSDYDEESKRTVIRAGEIAKENGDSQVMPYHLVLALIEADESAAAKVLQQAGVDLQSLKKQVEMTRYWAEGGPKVYLSPQSLLAMEAMASEARSLGVQTVGSDTLLLGLAFGNRAGIGSLITDLGASPARLRTLVADLRRGNKSGSDRAD